MHYLDSCFWPANISPGQAVGSFESSSPAADNEQGFRIRLHSRALYSASRINAKSPAGTHAQVSEVKALARDELLASRHAVLYSEPEKKVMSRSGDECVVALTDQWFLTYGEEQWRDRTRCG